MSTHIHKLLDAALDTVQEIQAQNTELRERKKAYLREWYAKNRERQIAAVTAWQRDNRERANANKRAYVERDPERRRNQANRYAAKPEVRAKAAARPERKEWQKAQELGVNL